MTTDPHHHPTRPLMLIAADPETGTVLGGWQADAASPENLAVQVAAGVLGHAAAPACPRIDPDRYQVSDTRRQAAAAGGAASRGHAGDESCTIRPLHDPCHTGCSEDGRTEADMSVAGILEEWRKQIREPRAPGGFWDHVAASGIGRTAPGRRRRAAAARPGSDLPAEPDPDTRVPLEQRCRDAARRALTVQLRATASRDEPLYFHGMSGMPSDVAIETDAGELVARLVNVGLHHAPAGGFGWGYGGSGAAALARSMLTALIGSAAACPSCNGTCTTGSGAACGRCQDGIRPLPYQQFKDQVLTGLDQDEGWTLPFDRVLAWLRTYPDPRAAAIAGQAGR